MSCTFFLRPSVRTENLGNSDRPYNDGLLSYYRVTKLGVYVFLVTGCSTLVRLLSVSSQKWKIQNIRLPLVLYQCLYDRSLIVLTKASILYKPPEGTSHSNKSQTPTPRPSFLLKDFLTCEPDSELFLSVLK